MGSDDDVVRTERADTHHLHFEVTPSVCAQVARQDVICKPQLPQSGKFIGANERQVLVAEGYRVNVEFGEIDLVSFQCVEIGNDILRRALLGEGYDLKVAAERFLRTTSSGRDGE